MKLNFYAICAFISLMMIFTSIAALVIDIAYYEGSVEIVDCFDKHNNKIVGVTCEEEITTSNNSYFLILLLSGFLYVGFSTFSVGESR